MKQLLEKKKKKDVGWDLILPISNWSLCCYHLEWKVLPRDEMLMHVGGEVVFIKDYKGTRIK